MGRNFEGIHSLIARLNFEKKPESDELSPEVAFVEIWDCDSNEAETLMSGCSFVEQLFNLEIQILSHLQSVGVSVGRQKTGHPVVR
jgi:hypothetical protein